MTTGEFLRAAVMVLALSAGLAQAKIPVAPMDDAAKAAAEEKKAKAAEAAKKAGEQLARAQDRVAERYKKEHGKGAKDAKAKETNSKETKAAAKK